ncbi:MAG: hypothetical protein AUI17_07445 [Acidobacteriales bacterium 13_2_20CM_2_55_5]|nr:MAG: hypothetical protein AUI17_07445 [Acidobacteriales bacterium 13_2_20CM_2_55_5]
MRWTGGNFQINFEAKTKEQTTTLNTQGLLIEGLRMLDESKRESGGFSVVAAEVSSDDQALIQQAITRLAKKARLVVTTGGTGIAKRDVTPEATSAVCERLVEGVAEKMRFEGGKKTRFAALSRGICGVRGESVILNVPGSPAGAVDSLKAVIDLMPHALQLLSGNTKHH